jgi:ParB family chromosome partitioning protein
MASKTSQPRLGRGLAALLGDAAGGLEEERRLVVANVPIDQIDTNPFQPRMDFDPNELESLAESIKVQGVLQPILVRKHPVEADRYQIIAGERRFRAAGLAGLTEIPTLLRDMDDSDAAVVALVENLQRQDLNPLEEAEGYQRLLDDFGLTQEALGIAVSKSRSHISNTVRLLRLPEVVKREVRVGSLSSGHARALLNAPNPEALAEQITKRGMSVRQAETLVAKAVAARGPTTRAVKPERLDIQELEKRATEQVGCRVSISLNRNGGGELSVQFRDARQLEELIDRLAARHAPAETGTDVTTD